MKPTPVLSLPEEYIPAVRARLLRWSTPAHSGCIEWMGSLDRHGYGKMALKHKKSGLQKIIGAHRAAWLSTNGDIPFGLQIDRLCRNIVCVNVDHMELVTGSVNCLRADHSNKKGRSGRRNNGGPFCDIHGDDHIRESVRKDGYTVRQCIICRRDYMRNYMRTRKKAA